MSADYTPSLISEFRTGINTYVQPWIRPSDAFDPLMNGYIYRGTLNRRNGSSLFSTIGHSDTNPVMGIMQFENAQTGEITLIAATTIGLYVWNTGTMVFDDITPSAGPFTGNISQFFNYTNWTPVVDEASTIYMTNNNDAPVSWNGSSLATRFLPTLSDGSTLVSCLDIKVYQNRLLLIAPITNASSKQQYQTIYYSAVNLPDGFDQPGAGSITFATQDPIVAVEYLRDSLIVFMSRSTWMLRYTGNDADPFRSYRISSVKTNNAPYGTLAFDERVTSIGNDGMIACDGTNVQRFDISIIDYYQTEFAEEYYGQTFSQRYDNLSQAWTLYVSNETQYPVVGEVAPGSDSALIYNFLENTFSTYLFPTPMTCMGLYYNQGAITWAELESPWNSLNLPWNSYQLQDQAPVLLMGDVNGNIYQMDNPLFATDNAEGTQVPFDFEFTTTQWNPSMTLGQKLQFGWLDVYYYVSSQPDQVPPVVLTLTFYVDNSPTPAATRTLTLDGTQGQGYSFKRVYMNLVGQFVQINFNDAVNEIDSYIQISGMILWTKPSGRLVPGSNVS